MNQPMRKRRTRRRLGDSNQSDLSLISRTETEAGSPAESTETESKNEPLPSNTLQVSVDSTTTHQMTIDRIRSEIQEEK